MKLKIFILICLLSPLLASLNSSFFFNETLPLRTVFLKPDAITSVSFLPDFVPILHSNVTYLNQEERPEHGCSVYQRKLEIQIEKSVAFDSSLQNDNYSSLLIPQHSILLMLSEQGKLLVYFVNDQKDLELSDTVDLSAVFTGSNKKLFLMQEKWTVLGLSDEKAVFFPDLSDFANYTVCPSYKPVSHFFKSVSFGNLIYVAAGADGVIQYELKDNDLIPAKTLLSQVGSFVISEARDISFFNSTLLVLDKNVGIMFFDLFSLEYLSTPISVMNGESFIHQYLNVFYLMGSENSRYFTYEIFYFGDGKTAIINRQSFESLPIKHATIINDYVFLLSGETIKIYYHSIPAEWVPQRYNVISFIAEEGLKNFFQIDFNNYRYFLGFTTDKILVMKVSETAPRMFCGPFGLEHRMRYDYYVEAVSKNCPGKFEFKEAPFYSICHGKQHIKLDLTQPLMKKWLTFENFTFVMMLILFIILIVSCLIGGFFFMRSRWRINNMENEMENLKRKFKYQEIVEDKEAPIAAVEDNKAKTYSDKDSKDSQ